MKLTIAYLSLLLLGTSIDAQSAESEIEKIEVTTTRISNNSLDIGSNISLVDSESLQLIEHQHINQALVRVPGGWISRGNGQEHLTAIRSPVLTGAGGCGAFFVAQDGISLRAPGFCNANQLFDANTEQARAIEVLRGPTSTLYGSNAVHGVINVLTTNPLDATGSDITVSFGPHDYSRALINLVADKNSHSVMINGNLTHDGGYLQDSGFEQQKLNFIHQYQGELWQVKNVLALTNLNQETAGFIRGFEAYKDAALKRQNPNPEAFRDSQSGRFYSQIAYANNDVKFMLTPYVRWTDMQFLQHFVPWQPLEQNGHSSAGLQAQFEQRYAELTFMSGFDLDYTQGQLTQTQDNEFSPNIPAGSHYDYNVDTLSYSPFVQLLWAVSPKFNVTTGLRYEKTDYAYNNLLSNGSACANDVDNCRFSRPADQDVNYDLWSHQLNANYVLGDNVRLYGQYSTGNRAPQTTELFRLQNGQSTADLDAEKMQAIEIGLRGFSHGFFYDVTGFSMRKDNFIFQDTQRQNISNGKTAHAGIELAIRYEWQSWYYTAAGTLAKHQYDNNLTLSQTNIKNNEIDTAPEHMGSMQLGWRGDAGGFIEIEWVHQGNYFLDPENSAEYAGHNLVNLRAGWPLSEKMQIAVRVTNLSDQDYAERADFGFGSYRYFVGEPRSVYVSFEYRFNTL